MLFRSAEEKLVCLVAQFLYTNPMDESAQAANLAELAASDFGVGEDAENQPAIGTARERPWIDTLVRRSEALLLRLPTRIERRAAEFNEQDLRWYEDLVLASPFFRGLDDSHDPTDPRTKVPADHRNRRPQGQGAAILPGEATEGCTECRRRAD